MRARAWMLGLMLAAGAGILAVAAGEGAKKGGKIAWGTDYDAVREAARKSGKPFLVYFTSER